MQKNMMQKYPTKEVKKMFKEEKIGTGIEGLDKMLGGGIPKGHTILVLGFCGTGKTTLAMQFIWEGLKHDENGIIISLEPSEESLVRTAGGYGWDFTPYLKNKKLVIVKLDPTDMKSTVTCIKKDFPEILKMFGAKRIVVDPLSLFEMMFEDVADRRIRIFELASLIKSSGATAIFTSETRTDQLSTSRDGLVEYASDGVILLRYIEPTDLSAVKLAMRIVKMREVKHSRDIRPYDITSKGIVVHSEADVY